MASHTVFSTTPIQPLRGKVALITGSTSGIGWATAQQLAKQGANIALHGLIAPEQGRALAKQLADECAVQCTLFDHNLADADAVRALIDSVAKQFGRLDILINNAGIQHTAPLCEFSAQHWQAIIAINLSAVFYAMQGALPLMQQQGWGRVINIASVHGLVASVNKAAYVAAKHGVVGLTKVAALEHANHGITVNALCPGWVATPLIEQQIADLANAQQLSIGEATAQLVSAKQPLQQMTEPKQIGEFVAFLCSDAARTLTGAALTMDGGWTAQ